MKPPKLRRLSTARYIQALALYTCGARHYREARKYEISLCDLLGIKGNYAGCLFDAMVDDSDDFDGALKKEGFGAPIRRR